MADISIRKLDDFVAMALKQRAALHGVSLEEEIRQILKDSVLPSKNDSWERAKAMREKLRAKYGSFPDSTPDIRKERDEM